MSDRTIQIKFPCTHEAMVDGELKLFLCLFNCDTEIPSDWHTTEDFIEMQLHFSLPLIAESITENYSLLAYDDFTFNVEDKPMVDALIQQFEDGLQVLKSIKYVEV